MNLAVNLTSEEVAQIKQFTNVQDDEAAVTLAVREYLRLSRIRELKAVSGHVDYHDVSEQIESLELEETDFPM